MAPDDDPLDEFRDHLDRRTADLVRAGVPRDEASRRARVEFGAIDRYREEAAEARRPWLTRADLLWRDVRMAVRRLRATPGFAAFAVVSLAIGLGVTTSIHAVMASILWRPAPVADPGRLAILTRASAGRTAWQSIVSRTDFADLRAADGGWRTAEAAGVVYQSFIDQPHGVVELVRGEAVTGGYFEEVGLRPAIGRLLGPGDDDPAAASVVVLGHALWTRSFAADTSVLGRPVRIGSQPFVIVGVAPEGFAGLSPEIQQGAEMWLPLSSATRIGGPVASANRSARQLTVFQRIADERGLGQLAAAAGVIASQLDAAEPLTERVEGGATRSIKRAWSASTIAAVADPPLRGTLMGVLIIGLVALVLVVACTNLANLVLARGTARQAEFALRHALGASRWRLIRELLIESTVLAVAGGLGAAAVTRVLITWFTTDVPISSGRTIRLEPLVSMPVTALAIGSLGLALLVFGVGPALHLVRRDLRPALGAEGGTPSRRGWRGRRRLVSWQVAISTAFFLVAAFCLQGVLRESRHDSGVDVERLAVGNLDFYLAPWTEPRAREAVDRLLARARQLPSVESAAVVSGMPFGTTLTPFANLSPDGEPGKTVVDAMLIASSPGVFRTAGVAILRGRAFDERDAAGTTPVAVVSEITARALFGGRDAIGRRISVQGVTTRDRNSYTHTIVGVAADTDAQFVFHRHMGSVYLPFAQRYEPALMLIARTSGDPAALLPGLRLAASRADPDLVLGHPTTGTMAFATMYELIRIAGTGATSLAGLSLVLAMTGLYGVLSQVVSGRTREIGVRMALGAERERIRRMVLRDGLMPVMVGVVLGAGLGGLIRLALHALTPASLSAGDAVIFSLVPLPLAAGALLACYLPALRASRVDPNVALRDI